MLNNQFTSPNLLSQYQTVDQLDQSLGVGTQMKHKKTSFFWLFFKLIFFAIIGGLLVIFALVLVNVKNVRAVYTGVTEGKANLEQALYQAQSRDFFKASETSGLAINNFKSATAELESFKLGPLSLIPEIQAYKTDAAHLGRGGEMLATAMKLGTDYAYNLEAVLSTDKTSSFSSLSTAEKRNILEAIYKADPTLQEVQTLIDKSLTEVQAARSFSWIIPLNTQVVEITKKLTDGKKTLASASPLTKLLPSLLGYPESSEYLFILQNSDELRPTGGFIGTYGIIQTQDGDFKRFETHDIYHLDMPVKDKVQVTPPAPIKQYLVDKWYMRDANWSPDWPTSAENILRFYNLENSAFPTPDPITKFDGVIAITPEVITDLMKLTGPIPYDGEIYTANNFVDLLQYKVEREYIQLGVSSWHRKEVIGEIARILKERLLDLPLERWPELIQLLGDTMARKNVLLYAKEPNLQALISEQGWSGEMKHFWGDYLMVVDANLAALKTDAVMKRHVDYKVEEKNGELTATVTLSYSHNGSVDWKTSRYQSFTRVYVPAGSILQNSSGFAPGSVMSGEELGRTYFGGFVIVPPQQTAQFTLEYRLPRRMIDNMKTYKNYGLLIQKQPGTGKVGFSVDVAFANKIQSYNPVNLYSETPAPTRFTTQGDLEIDRNFLINF